MILKEILTKKENKNEKDLTSEYIIIIMNMRLITTQGDLEMRPPKLRAWNLELKMMIESEEVFTRENIHMLLNTSDDYIWMRDTEYKDRGAKEIYEGDILIYRYLKYEPVKFIVEYDDFIWRCCELGYEEAYLANIGNIYKNPELIVVNELIDRMENKNVD